MFLVLIQSWRIFWSVEMDIFCINLNDVFLTLTKGSVWLLLNHFFKLMIKRDIFLLLFKEQWLELLIVVLILKEIEMIWLNIWYGSFQFEKPYLVYHIFWLINDFRSFVDLSPNGRMFCIKLLWQSESYWRLYPTWRFCFSIRSRSWRIFFSFRLIYHVNLF